MLTSLIASIPPRHSSHLTVKHQTSLLCGLTHKHMVTLRAAGGNLGLRTANATAACVHRQVALLGRLGLWAEPVQADGISFILQVTKSVDEVYGCFGRRPATSAFFTDQPDSLAAVLTV